MSQTFIVSFRVLWYFYCVVICVLCCFVRNFLLSFAYLSYIKVHLGMGMQTNRLNVVCGMSPWNISVPISALYIRRDGIKALLFLVFKLMG